MVLNKNSVLLTIITDGRQGKGNPCSKNLAKLDFLLEMEHCSADGSAQYGDLIMHFS